MNLINFVSLFLNSTELIGLPYFLFQPLSLHNRSIKFRLIIAFHIHLIFFFFLNNHHYIFIEIFLHTNPIDHTLSLFTPIFNIELLYFLMIIQLNQLSPFLMYIYFLVQIFFQLFLFHFLVFSKVLYIGLPFFMFFLSFFDLLFQRLIFLSKLLTNLFILHLQLLIVPLLIIIFLYLINNDLLLLISQLNYLIPPFLNSLLYFVIISSTQQLVIRHPSFLKLLLNPLNFSSLYILHIIFLNNTTSTLSFIIIILKIILTIVNFILTLINPSLVLYTLIHQFIQPRSIFLHIILVPHFHYFRLQILLVEIRLRSSIIHLSYLALKLSNSNSSSSNVFSKNFIHCQITPYTFFIGISLLY